MSTARAMAVGGWLAAAVMAALPGCDVTPEKIERWKGTERGPAKLRDVVHGKGTPELRGLALAALVEIGMLAEAEEDLKGASPAERSAIAHAAVPKLVTIAAGPADAAVERTTAPQRSAKDALFDLRADATPEDRALIDDTLVAWLARDVAGRMSAGARSGEQIVDAAGARAGAKLAEVVVDERTSEGSRTEAARLLGRVGDAATRDAAGVKLCERARHERTLQEGTLRQIGLVGGDHAIAWLTGMVDSSREPLAMRSKAMAALGLRPDPAALAVALRVAGSASMPGELRESAFGVSQSGGPGAVPGLVKLIADRDPKVRWRSVEAALAAGQARAVVPVLEALPRTLAVSPEDLQSYVVADLGRIGAPALPPLREELASKSPLARLAAVRAIAALGKADDAPRLDALAADATRLGGWPGGTLGAVAKAAADTLREKK